MDYKTICLRLITKLLICKSLITVCFEQTTVASVQSIYVMAVSKEFIVSIQIV